MEDLLKTASIMIVDDNPANVIMLERLLKKQGYETIYPITDPEQAVLLFGIHQPDLLILDLHMPKLDGYGVLEKLEPYVAGSSYYPVLVLTADATSQAKQRALSLGAKDFLTKPLDALEGMLRIKNLLQTRFLWRDMEAVAETRNKQLKKAFAITEQARQDSLEMLALMGEYRDDDTGEHTFRVANLAADLAESLNLSANSVNLIRNAARLHDLGKVAIPDSILLKPGKLTEEEYEIVKTHAQIGADILGKGHSPVLQLAKVIALSHHERWDGQGYPNRLEAEDIPIEGRITAVADVFDALSNDRPYRAAWPQEKVLAEIESQSAKHFDPKIVEALIKLKTRALVIN